MKSAFAILTLVAVAFGQQPSVPDQSVFSLDPIRMMQDCSWECSNSPLYYVQTNTDVYACKKSCLNRFNGAIGQVPTVDDPNAPPPGQQQTDPLPAGTPPAMNAVNGNPIMGGAGPAAVNLPVVVHNGASSRNQMMTAAIPLFVLGLFNI